MPTVQEKKVITLNNNELKAAIKQYLGIAGQQHVHSFIYRSGLTAVSLSSVDVVVYDTKEKT
jgi:hypothetical protein